ncbi:uncharacterized protein VTP21DRAFT_10636 [Calcarisporiella thermophila]|uniref:uncharacterized protein n=1 Tax=Calcarisporiella thermophila TaxID=911321 RepID=UPI0037432C79
MRGLKSYSLTIDSLFVSDTSFSNSNHPGDKPSNPLKRLFRRASTPGHPFPEASTKNSGLRRNSEHRRPMSVYDILPLNYRFPSENIVGGRKLNREAKKRPLSGFFDFGKRSTRRPRDEYTQLHSKIERSYRVHNFDRLSVAQEVDEEGEGEEGSMDEKQCQNQVSPSPSDMDDVSLSETIPEEPKEYTEEGTFEGEATIHDGVIKGAQQLLNEPGYPESPEDRKEGLHRPHQHRVSSHPAFFLDVAPRQRDSDSRVSALECQMEHLILQNVRLQRASRLLEDEANKLRLLNSRLQRANRRLHLELDENVREMRRLREEQKESIRTRAEPEYEFLVSQMLFLHQQLAGGPTCVKMGKVELVEQEW